MRKSTAQRLWYKEMLEKHERSLLRYCYGLCGDENKAKELVQHAFTKLWEQDFLKLEKRVLPWLFTVCRNAFIDSKRLEKKMISIETEKDGEKIESTLQTLFFPEEEIAKNEIFDVIKGFPQEQQEVFFLKFQEGHTNVEISEILGLTATNIGVLLFRGLKVIRERLGVKAS